MRCCLLLSGVKKAKMGVNKVEEGGCTYIKEWVGCNKGERSRGGVASAR